MTALEDKEKQKALLIEIIQEDEKNGMYEDDLITEIDDIVGGTPFNVLIYPDRVILTEKRDGHPVKVTEYTRNPQVK